MYIFAFIFKFGWNFTQIGVYNCFKSFSPLWRKFLLRIFTITSTYAWLMHPTHRVRVGFLIKQTGISRFRNNTIHFIILNTSKRHHRHKVKITVHSNVNICFVQISSVDNKHLRQVILTYPFVSIQLPKAQTGKTPAGTGSVLILNRSNRNRFLCCKNITLLFS